MLKYWETNGIKDLGNPVQRPINLGKHDEIENRVKHTKSSQSIE